MQGWQLHSQRLYRSMRMQPPGIQKLPRKLCKSRTARSARWVGDLRDCGQIQVLGRSLNLHTLQDKLQQPLVMLLAESLALIADSMSNLGLSFTVEGRHCSRWSQLSKPCPRVNGTSLKPSCPAS